MKTKILILTVWLAGFDLWAQTPTPPATNVTVNAIAATNRAEILRSTLRRAVARGTNVTLVTTPASESAASTAPTSPVVTAPAVPVVPALPGISTPAPATTVTPNPAPTVTVAASPAPKPADDEVPGYTYNWVNTDLNQVLDFYARLVNRTILRPASLTSPLIILKTQSPLTKSEAKQALEAILSMNGIAMIPVGEKFVKAIPTAQANLEGAKFNTNSAEELPEVGQYVTHVMQLTYSRPSELVQVLQPFAKMPNSILAIDSSGILVLRDYTENVKRMLEMIAKVDVAVPAEILSEVIPIKYALAVDIASALNSVGGTTAGTVGGGSGSSPARAPGSTLGTRPITSAGGTGFGTQLGASRYGGTAGAAPGMPAPGLNPGGAAGAGSTFGDRINAIIRRASSGGGAGDFQILGQTKIIADERTNSLLVFATRQDMDMIKSIVAKLDVVLQQVLIEAIILDVTLADSFDFSVSAGQAPLSTGNATGGGAINNGKGSLANGLAFLNNLIPSFVTNITAIATNITTIFNQSPNVAFPNSDGLTYFGKIGPTWNVALSALSGNNNVKVLARPSIQTSHAVPAEIFVGETRPYITGTSYDAYNSGSRSQYQQSQIGITLNVTPLINPDGLVVMDIQQQVQQVGGSVMIDGNAVPITQDQHASSKVAVRNGETIVMGGFIQNQKSEAKSGIPFLKDIPLFGALFRSTTSSSARRELLVLIRPTVLPTPEAAALQTDVQRNRLPIVKAAEADFSDDDARLLKHANKKEKPPGN